MTTYKPIRDRTSIYETRSFVIENTGKNSQAELYKFHALYLNQQA